MSSSQNNLGDMKQYLRRTYFLNYNSPVIREKTTQLLQTIPDDDDIQKVITLFYFVRDEIKYVAKLEPKYYRRRTTRASETLTRGDGYCIQKAVLMASMARLIGIPARLHFVDMMNHLTPRKFIERMGSDRFIYHAYPELFLNGKWVEANVAFDKELCTRKNFPIVDFDGINPGLFAKTDDKGNRFVEYIKDHGTFPDVPYYRIIYEWVKFYGYRRNHRKK